MELFDGKFGRRAAYALVTATLFVNCATAAPISGDTKAISAGDAPVAVTATRAISTGDTRAISVGDTKAISVADLAAISVGDTRAISVADIAAISTGDTKAISVADVTAISAGDTKAISVADIAAISAGDTKAISVGDITAISTGDTKAISVADVTAISAGDTKAISVGDLQPVSLSDLKAISVGDTKNSGLATFSAFGEELDSKEAAVAETDVFVVLAGAVESVNLESATVTILGKTVAIEIEAALELNVGDYAGVLGRVFENGEVEVESIGRYKEAYMPGVSPVLRAYHVSEMPKSLDLAPYFGVASDSEIRLVYGVQTTLGGSIVDAYVINGG